MIIGPVKEAALKVLPPLSPYKRRGTCRQHPVGSGHLSGEKDWFKDEQTKKVTVVDNLGVSILLQL